MKVLQWNLLVMRHVLLIVDLVISPIIHSSELEWLKYVLTTAIYQSVEHLLRKKHYYYVLIVKVDMVSGLMCLYLYITYTCCPLIIGALTYPAFGTSSDYSMNTEATTVATDVYCSPNQFYDFVFDNCNQTLANSTDGCLSHQPQQLITCFTGKIIICFV